MSGYVTARLEVAVDTVGAQHVMLRPVSAAASRGMFFAALLGVTALPLLVLGFVFAAAPDLMHTGMSAALLPLLFIATGNGHVLATAFFYLDQDLFGLIRSNRRVFFLWPALVVAMAVGAHFAGPLAYRIMICGFFAWNLWHFQRQNYGVIAFAAQAQGLGPLPKAMNPMLNLSAASGICAVLSRPEFIGLPALVYLAAGLLAASAVLLGYMLLADGKMLSRPLVVAFSVLGWAFFVPALLSSEPTVALISYGVAHGAQYLIFMGVMSRGGAHRAAGPVLLCVLAVGLTALFCAHAGDPVWAATYMGVVMAHFVIDAKVWRMREPLQRALIRRRFAFLYR